MRQPQVQRRAQRRTPSTFDADAREAATSFVRVLARRGYTPQDIGAEVLRACRRIPRSWAQTAKVAVSQIDAAGHVLTLWFQDPAYLDSMGNPQPLSLRGADLSIEALARRVDAELDVEEILSHLLRRSVLRRNGTRYLPRSRVLMFRGSGASYHARSMQALVAMLSTLERNSRPGHSTPVLFERFAANVRVPVGAVAAFDRWLHRNGNRLLEQADAKLHAYERKRRKGERTIRLGVGVYRFGEEQPPPAKHQTRRRK